MDDVHDCISFRCYLPTGLIRWLCPEHQEGHRITVLGSDSGGATDSNEYVNEDDIALLEAITRHAERLGAPLKQHRTEPRKLPEWKDVRPDELAANVKCFEENKPDSNENREKKKEKKETKKKEEKAKDEKTKDEKTKDKKTKEKNPRERRRSSATSKPPQEGNMRNI